MKFGIFYELQLPRPWESGDEHQLYQNALDQVELADRLGYDYAWEVEHHFLEEYSHSPAPEVFLGAASQRTKNIRLGHGIMQLTTNHPARVAERIAALDLVSNGRVEFGTGESASITELEPFERRLWTKSGRSGRRRSAPSSRCSRTGGCEHHGKYFKMPLRNVLPKPVQKPHPPLWVACSQLETSRWPAARPRRARLPVPVGRRGACLGARLLQRLHQAAGEARRLRDQPEHRDGPATSCAPRPTRRRAAAPTASRSSSSRCASTAERRTRRPPDPGTVNLWDEYEKWKRDNPEAHAARCAAG